MSDANGDSPLWEGMTTGELRAELTRLRGKPAKVAFSAGNWIALVGVVVTGIALTAGLMSALFEPKAAAAASDARMEEHFKAQDKTEKRWEERFDKFERKLDVALGLKPNP